MLLQTASIVRPLDRLRRDVAQRWDQALAQQEATSAGIAARNDEHMQVITRLTNALDEPGLIDRLASTQDPQEFLDLLGAEQAA